MEALDHFLAMGGYARFVWPAYVLAVRELFPASEASWRVPSVLLFSGSGMAFGGWLAGAIYDSVGFYAAAFAAGIVFNFAHLIVIGSLAWRPRRTAISQPMEQL